MNNEKTSNYDVIIVGTGPAGIFSALELIKDTPDDFKILMIDSGNDIRTRIEIRQSGSKNEIMQGWGGAGAFSDGKLTLSVDVGGSLSQFIPINQLEKDLKTVEKIYIEFSTFRD